MQFSALRLTGARNRADISQSDLANKIGRGLRTIQSWEKAETVPNADDLAALCGALDTSITYLMGMDPEPVEEGPEAHRETSAPVDSSSPEYSRRLCRDYLERFLDSCGENAARLGWTLMEMQSRFPLDKWATLDRQSALYNAPKAKRFEQTRKGLVAVNSEVDSLASKALASAVASLPHPASESPPTRATDEPSAKTSARAQGAPKHPK